MRIKPHKIIVPGCGIQVAEQFCVTSDEDNLVNRVDFRISLHNADGVELVFTHYSLDASNYGTWDATAEGAHRICAQALGVTLV